MYKEVIKELFGITGHTAYARRRNIHCTSTGSSI